MLSFIVLAIVYNPWWLVVPTLMMRARVASIICNRREGRRVLWPLVFRAASPSAIYSFVGWPVGVSNGTEGKTRPVHFL
jgi:hypothetical protein